MDIPKIYVGKHNVTYGCYSDMKEIESINCFITYDEFFQRFLLRNRPCILKSWITQSWLSRTDWVKNNEINFECFTDNFGDAVSPVADCSKEKFSSHPKEDMTVKAFFKYLHKYQEKNTSDEMPSLYLKDWHFSRCFPNYQAYTTPEYFQSDWLNEFWDSKMDEEDDYRFVYIGPKESWTPLHADVFRSYSWSANIVGRKHWTLFAPGEEQHLKDNFGNLLYNLNDYDEVTFPNVHRVQKRFEVIQEAGEVIFVPSGWHHQVTNLEETVSINHNWINGCNVYICWSFIKNSLKEVQQELNDCQEMDGYGDHCQIMLKACSGINYKEFYNFLHTIGSKRLHFLLKHSTDRQKNQNNRDSEKEMLPWSKVLCQPFSLNVNHALFDLASILDVLNNMLRTHEFDELQLSSDVKAFHQRLIDCLSVYQICTEKLS